VRIPVIPATQSGAKRLWRDFGDPVWESPLNTENGKDVRRHDPPRRTALGLRCCGVWMGLGRDRLAGRLGLLLLWRQHEAAA
jgi:hypothetical protein